MGGEWVHRTIGDIAEVFGGSTPSTKDPENFNGDIPWLTPKDLSGPHPRYVTRGERNLSRRGLRNSSAQLLPKNTVLLSSRAPIGYVAIAANPIATNQGFRSLVVKPGYDHEFLYYWLLANVEELERNASGSTFKELSGSSLKSIPIRLPSSLAEQQAVAHVLGALDDKVEVNRRMSWTLEETIRTHFRSWFKDFEPTRTKEGGGESALPPYLSECFPDRLVNSPIGSIPEGWQLKPAGDLFEVTIGRTPPRKERQWFSVNPQDMPWMSIRDLGAAGPYISEVTEYLTPSAVERFRLRPIPDGTVVLSFKLTVGRVAITDGTMLSNEAIAHFRPRRGTYLDASYLYCYLRQFDFDSLGSTSSIATATNSATVREIPVLLPPANVHEGFVRATRSSFLRIRSLDRESRLLREIRNAMLPKLVTGEIRLGEHSRLSLGGA